MPIQPSHPGSNVKANGSNFAYLRLLTGDADHLRGHKLTQVTIQFKEKTVTVMLKKESPKGPQVAFLEALNMEDALYVAACAISSKTIPWKPDKWGSMRNDKK